MLDQFDDLYDSLKDKIVTDFSSKELHVEQRRSLLDSFFHTLDTKALAITTSQPFLFVKAAEASLTPLSVPPVGEAPPTHPEACEAPQ
jgi:hypothetical protein